MKGALTSAATRQSVDHPDLFRHRTWERFPADNESESKVPGQNNDSIKLPQTIGLEGFGEPPSWSKDTLLWAASIGPMVLFPAVLTVPRVSSSIKADAGIVERQYFLKDEILSS